MGVVVGACLASLIRRHGSLSMLMEGQGVRRWCRRAVAGGKGETGRREKLWTQCRESLASAVVMISRGGGS